MSTPSEPTDTPPSGGVIDRRALPAAVGLVMILAAMSGVVDTVAYQRFGVFVANQTGNLVIVMVDATSGKVTTTLIASLVSLAFFVLGVVGAVALRNFLRRSMTRHHVRMVLLGVEAFCIAVVASGVFIFGESQLAYGAIALLAVSQGVQGVVVMRVVGVMVQSVVINTAIVQVADWLSRGYRRAALIAFAVPVGYFLGATMGAVLTRLPPPTALVSALVLALLSLVVAAHLRSRGGDLD
ncbi:MAG: YoaK family protein [Actinomycetota bacterium]